MSKFTPLEKIPDNAHYCRMNSPVGELTLIADDKGLHALLWDNFYQQPQCEILLHRLTHNPNALCLQAPRQQLTEYFLGERQQFDLPLVLSGTTFQQQTWRQLQTIPYAKTISYGEQALALGNKNKARAVGMANGMNPISIIIPCHRVIGSTGKLTGFGGGVDRKAWLLAFEGKTSSNTPSSTEFA
jgi:methylated-DNA-[protein]-cysteine S-methyltransferase